MLFQSNGICPVCKSVGVPWCITQDWEYRSTTDFYTYLKCPSCKTLFLKELREDNLLRIYPPGYYSFTQKPGGGIFKLKDWWDASFYKSILKKNSAESLAVLDVGGGTGQVLDTLKKADKRIDYTEIIDIDVHAQAIAEKKGHIYTCSTIEAYHTEKKFEVILLLNIIEHVADPCYLIKKAELLLSDNGIIIIKTPNADSLDARLFRKHYWGGLHCPRHWIIFTEPSFKRMLSSTKMHIQHLKFTQGAPFWSYSIINLFRKKDITRKKKPLIESPFFAPLSALFAFFDIGRSFFSPTSQMFIILRR